MADTQEQQDEEQEDLQVVPSDPNEPEEDVYTSDESDEEGGEDVEEEDVTLGFVEPADQPELLAEPEGFPDKVGGKPVWLDLEHLVPADNLVCQKCNKQMIFLLQIYAPIQDNPNAYHRTLFVFCCKNGACKSFKAIRVQLPRDNKFYTVEDKEEDIELKDESSFKSAPLCEICGCLAPKRCGHCHQVSYCSREHQLEDWKIGHQEICKKIQEWKKERGFEEKKEIPKSVELPKFRKYSTKFLFKEFEMLTDPEPDAGAEKEIPDIEKQGLISKYNDYLKNWNSKDNAELNDDFKAGHTDKLFARFNNRISRDPEQVLRYIRSETAKPLWVSTKSQPGPGGVPDCPLCNGPRKFEFQILPQLLYYLGVEEDKDKYTPLDWGTLVVFSCWNSCSLPSDKNWAEEFLWNQDMAS